jgi:hypothetical protein
MFANYGLKPYALPTSFLNKVFGISIGKAFPDIYVLTKIKKLSTSTNDPTLAESPVIRRFHISAPV